MADPRTFIESKIAELLAYSKEVQAMDLTDEDDASSTKISDFIEGITEVMYRIEGISHFTIDNFYTFDYLDEFARRQKPSFEQLTEQWHTTFAEYDAVLLKQIGLSQAKIAAVEEENSDLEMSSYVEKRVSTYRYFLLIK